MLAWGRRSIIWLCNVNRKWSHGWVLAFYSQSGTHFTYDISCWNENVSREFSCHDLCKTCSDTNTKNRTLVQWNLYQIWIVMIWFKWYLPQDSFSWCKVLHKSKVSAAHTLALCSTVPLWCDIFFSKLLTILPNYPPPPPPPPWGLQILQIYKQGRITVLLTNVRLAWDNFIFIMIIFVQVRWHLYNKMSSKISYIRVLFW